MRGLLIKGLSVTDVHANELDDYYRLLEVDTIDIVTRKINGKYFDIVCDDEALFKTYPVPTVFDTDKQPMIFGNIIIAGLADDAGNMTDLTDEDINRICENLGMIRFVDGSKHACLVNVKY